MNPIQRSLDWLLGWSLLLLAALVFGVLWLVDRLFPNHRWEDDAP